MNNCKAMARCSYLVLALVGWMAPNSPIMAAEYSGSKACASCHEQEFKKWENSHHYQSMLPADEKSVIGNFQDQTFEYGGMSHRFFKQDGGYFVETDNAEGELETFRIAYTFGFYPLQQYLIGFDDGRYQALNIVWDSREAEAGGQRWYHLYPDEVISHDDGLHWTGSFQNWNSRCATCHSTDLKKNYQLGDNSYATTWAEINVGCEACHGPSSTHVSWAQGENSEAPNKGLLTELANAAQWAPVDGSHTQGRDGGARPNSQIQGCAGCHSRRSEMDEDHVGKRFSDLYQLQMLDESLYHPDGQILEEVYVFGSFLQSKMYAAGVACTNCHDPHSNKLIASGNQVCTQCHDNGTFDTPAHHHHAQDSSGAQCANCHMPAKTYMGVDDRRDHSFRIPEPGLSKELGTPNACNQCHDDKDESWAMVALKEWQVSEDIRAKHAPVLHRARSNDASVAPLLLALANDQSSAGILRATAILETRRFPSRETYDVVNQQLYSTNDLVRAATVRSLDWLPAGDRYAILQPMMTDRVKAVRMEVANRLADIPINQLPPENRPAFTMLRNEYLDTLKLNADMPEALLNLGIFLSSSGQAMEAEKAYRQALKLSPQFVPAMLNLADLYRANEMDRTAEPLLQRAIDTAPEQPAAYHALGLLQVRRQQMAEALDNLATAYQLDPAYQRYAYVYAVALHSDKQFDKGIEVLESSLLVNTGNQELITALMSFYQQKGATDKLNQLMQRYPQQTRNPPQQG